MNLVDKIHEDFMLAIAKKTKLESLKLNFKNELTKSEFNLIATTLEPLPKIQAFSLECRVFYRNFEDDAIKLCKVLSEKE